jgi:integrase/recombinase XerD
MHSLKMVEALIPERGRMCYLVDANLDFIPEVREFLDWKAATKRAPATIQAYCSRLFWYYRFLDQKNLRVLEATPADLTEFVIWLCNPYRDSCNVAVIHEPSPLQATSVNLILQAAGSLYRFLVRRGMLTESPVRSVEVSRSKWLTEHDLLTHTRKGQPLVQRSELKLKEPSRIPSAISEQDFQTFVDSIHMGEVPNSDPSGFRDRLICFILKEGGFRLGELLGMHLEDLDFGKQGVHVRFRADNQKPRPGMLDVYITEVWIEANPHTDHLWIVLKKEARDREGAADIRNSPQHLSCGEDV